MKQSLQAVRRIETLLICLTGLRTVFFEHLVSLSTADRRGECRRVTGAEQHAVHPVGDELGKGAVPAATGATPRAIASTAARPNVSSQADGRTTTRAAPIAAAHASGSSWPTTRTDGRDAAQALT